MENLQTYNFHCFCSSTQRSSHGVERRSTATCNLVNWFNNSVHFAVNARLQGDENLKGSVVAETMNLLANSLHGYQAMDRRCHSVTRYMNDEK